MFFPGPQGTRQRPHPEGGGRPQGQAARWDRTATVGSRCQDTPALQLETRGPEGHHHRSGQGHAPRGGQEHHKLRAGDEAGGAGASEHGGLGHSPRMGLRGTDRELWYHCQVQRPEPDPPAPFPAALRAQGPDHAPG